MQVSKLVSYPVHFAFKEYYFHDMAKPTLVYMYNSTTSNTKKVFQSKNKVILKLMFFLWPF